MMATNILTATVAVVSIGSIQFEGLKLEDGSYAIAVPQSADFFETSRNTAARDFKRLLGADFKTSKVKTVFN